MEKVGLSYHARRVSDALEKYAGETTEFEEVIREAMPEGMLDQFEAQYEPPKFLKPDDVGQDRVCTRCGAIVHEGGKKKHQQYHRQLTMGIWMLQGFSLAQSYARAQESDGGRK